mgnify:CR=1 FL=1
MKDIKYEEAVRQLEKIVDKMESGLNAPPMHPYCRCAVAEVYVEDSSYWSR